MRRGAGKAGKVVGIGKWGRVGDSKGAGNRGESTP